MESSEKDQDLDPHTQSNKRKPGCVNHTKCLQRISARAHINQVITQSPGKIPIFNVFMVTLKDPISAKTRHNQNLLKRITDWK